MNTAHHERKPASHTASGQSNAAAQEETRLGGDVVGGGHSGRLFHFGQVVNELAHGLYAGVVRRADSDLPERGEGHAGLTGKLFDLRVGHAQKAVSDANE